MNKKLPQTIDWRGRLFMGLTLGLAFLLTIRPPWDPDLGWHLRNGGDILKFGVPRGDIYSHTMAGYPWISHEWLTDVLMYLTQHHLGLLALVVMFALIAVTAYLLAARVSSVNWGATILATFIAVLVAYPVVGVRPQLLTLLGLAIALWLLFRWRIAPANKLIYWLVPLMLLWVNLHGGFMAGLILIGTFGIGELGKIVVRRYWPKLNLSTLSPGQLWQLIGVGCLSVLVTLINPYTWRVYQEFFNTVFNQSVRTGILEWLPVNFSNSNGFNLLIYLILLLVFVLISWRRMDITKIFIGVAFFAIAISSWRNVPLFPLVTLPLLADAIAVLLPAGISYYTKSIWVILVLLIGIGYFGYDQYHTVLPPSLDLAVLAKISKNPAGAVQYIKEHQLPGKLFNEYNWGGYLIWQLPEKQVFIDGRMAIWQTPNQNLFGEYQSLSTEDEPTTTILDRYGVGLALIYRQRPLEQYFLRHGDTWQLVYIDELSVLFRRISQF
ncbi:hypothetical protein JXA59_01310 [Patescibacteria group bacterium]|nr:hypothetical protein [Patescibacteria group bacterium]